MDQLIPGPAGRLSLTDRPVAAVDELSARVTVKPIGEPNVTLPASATFVMATSWHEGKEKEPIRVRQLTVLVVE